MTLTNNDKEITYLLGQEINEIKPLSPFDPLICDFLGDFSLALKKAPELRDYPDIASLSFWCRKAHIHQLKKRHLNERIRVGRGLVFHIAPSNVPVNFAFSLIFGLLSGNANIVKVSSKDFSQTQIICQAIKQVLKDAKYIPLKKMISIIKCERTDELIRNISSKCNARIIWGGDQTVNDIRSFPISVRGIDIAFSDRYSFSVIDCPSLDIMEDNDLNTLAQNFYNDSFVMDQNACTSPHLIIWVGKISESAKNRFWNAVANIVIQKYPFMAVKAVDKYTLLCQNAIDLEGIESFSKHGNYIYRVKLNNLSMDNENYRGKFGYFFEYDSSDLTQSLNIVNEKYQTLTYFGLDPNNLIKSIIDSHTLGIDRIVPMGRALDIGLIWDGVDIINSLSRVITIDYPINYQPSPERGLKSTVSLSN